MELVWLWAVLGVLIAAVVVVTLLRGRGRSGEIPAGHADAAGTAAAAAAGGAAGAVGAAGVAAAAAARREAARAGNPEVDDRKIEDPGVTGSAS